MRMSKERRHDSPIEVLFPRSGSSLMRFVGKSSLVWFSTNFLFIRSWRTLSRLYAHAVILSYFPIWMLAALSIKWYINLLCAVLGNTTLWSRRIIYMARATISTLILWGSNEIIWGLYTWLSYLLSKGTKILNKWLFLIYLLFLVRAFGTSNSFPHVSKSTL